MSKLDKMSILGVRSFGVEDKDKQVITFFSPLTVLVGPNGAGKTTIVECLRYATTGDLPPGSRGGAFVHDPRDVHETDVRAQIRLVFTDVRGEKVAVQRSMSCSQKVKTVQFHAQECVLTRVKDGKKVSLSSKCAELEMIAALGVSKAVLNHVIFCHQEESNWPLGESKALKGKFDAIFDATKYTKALDAMRRLRLKQAQVVKECQIELRYLKQNKEKAQQLRDTLSSKEMELAAPRDRVRQINGQIEPLEARTDDMDRDLGAATRLDSDVKALESRGMQMEQDNRELEESMTEQVFQGSDEQLRDMHQNHRETVREKERRLADSETELEGADRERHRLHGVQSELLVERGRLQLEADRHAQNVASRDSRVRSLATSLGLEGHDEQQTPPPPPPLTEQQLQSFRRHATDRLERERETAERVASALQEEERQKQRSADETRDEKTGLERTVELKRELQARKQQELRSLQAELQRLDEGCSSSTLDSELERAEQDLRDVLQSSDVEALKAEVAELQRERAELDGARRRLDQEMETLSTQGAARAQLDMLERLRAEKEEQVRRIRSRHGDELASLLGGGRLFPDNTELEDWIHGKAKGHDEQQTPPPPPPLTEQQLQSFRRHATDRLERERETAERVASALQEEERQKQRSADETRDEKTGLERTVELKRELQARKQQELRSLQAELQRLDEGCSSSTLDSELERAEQDLRDVLQSSDVEALKAEVAELQRERAELDGARRRLDQEMETLSTQGAARAQLDMLERLRAEKEEQVRRIRSRHGDELASLLGGGRLFPDNTELEDWIHGKAKEIDGSRDALGRLHRELAAGEQTRSHLSGELRGKEQQLAGDQEKLLDTCGESQVDLDRDLGMLQEELDEASERRAALAGATAVYGQFIGQLTEEREDREPRCPVCQRAFQSESELQDVVSDTRSKLRLVPDRLESAEQDLRRKERRRDDLAALRPVQERVAALLDRELPELRQRLQAVQADVKRLRADVEAREGLLSALLSQKERAAACLQDVSLADRHAVDLREAERKIARQADELRGTAASVDLDRTVRQVGQERQETQRRLDAASDDVELKSRLIQERRDRIQALKSSADEARAEKLRLGNVQQRQRQLQEQAAGFTAEVQTVTREIREARERLPAMSAALEKLQRERQELAERRRRTRGEAQESINAVKDELKTIAALERDVDEYVEDGKERYKEQKERELQETNAHLHGTEKLRERINKEMGNLRQDIDTQRIQERWLQDNVTLRRRAEELKQLADKRRTLTRDAGHVDVTRIQKERREAERELEELKRNRSMALGRQHAVEDETLRYEKELREEQYDKADELHRDKMIVMRTTELAGKDLDVYYKALDRSIMTFHGAKMDEINKTVRDLWRGIYRGRDVEHVEIRSDVDEKASAELRRREYHYRVVTVTEGGVASGMRGRCSAGQKVLASLVIRLALAETFGLNCGVLALDEPTANLDRENVESLAAALVEMARSRSATQRSFQLLVITHDEDFVEMLGRSSYVEHFYRIRKNRDGNSEIDKCSITSLSSYLH